MICHDSSRRVRRRGQNHVHTSPRSLVRAQRARPPSEMLQPGSRRVPADFHDAPWSGAVAPPRTRRAFEFESCRQIGARPGPDPINLDPQARAPAHPAHFAVGEGSSSEEVREFHLARDGDGPNPGRVAGPRMLGTRSRQGRANRQQGNQGHGMDYTEPSRRAAPGPRTDPGMVYTSALTTTTLTTSILVSCLDSLS